MKGLEVTAWGILGLLFLQIPALGWLAKFHLLQRRDFSLSPNSLRKL